jgi:hypothetical protein
MQLVTPNPCVRTDQWEHSRLRAKRIAVRAIVKQCK